MHKCKYDTSGEQLRISGRWQVHRGESTPVRVGLYEIAMDRCYQAGEVLEAVRWREPQTGQIAPSRQAGTVRLQLPGGPVASMGGGLAWLPSRCGAIVGGCPVLQGFVSGWPPVQP